MFNMIILDESSLKPLKTFGDRLAGARRVECWAQCLLTGTALSANSSLQGPDKSHAKSLQAMLLAHRSLCKLLLLRFRVCKNLCKDPQAPWAACIEPSRFYSGSVRSPRFQCLAYKLRKILMSWLAIRVACQSGSDAAACLHERSWRQPDG